MLDKDDTLRLALEREKWDAEQVFRERALVLRERE